MQIGMHNEFTYVRLTKIRGDSALAEEPIDALSCQTSEGSPDHPIGVGYVIDGWFLDEPCPGRRMLLLRFRRNGTNRLGLYTSSPVTHVAEDEIWTVNSVYRLEHYSFEQLDPE